jgi:phage shock protein PspC (stress-responsive transcriptional regulator)
MNEGLVNINASNLNQHFSNIMKKTISINISGIIFHIEEDGYEKLKNYLSSIQRYFSGYEDCSEIISDIESRIAEIFLAKLGPGKQVITADDVEKLIVTMGTISDFEAIETEEPGIFGKETYATSGIGDPAGTTEAAPKRLYRDVNRKLIGGVAAGIAHYFTIDPLWIRLIFVACFLDLFFLPGSFSSASVIIYAVLWIVVPGSMVLMEDKTIKKFYRNPDNKTIGGVASGLAAYFGTDVTIIRLVFVFCFFFFGAGLILYLVLWAITPEAKTLTEKMKMQGEPVTLSNIETNIKKSLIGTEYGEENTLVKILLFPFRVIAAVFNGLGKALGPMAVFLLEMIRIAVGVLLVIVAIGFLVALLVTLGIGLGVVTDSAFMQLGDVPIELVQHSFPVGGMIAVFLSLVIPVVFLILLGLTLLAKRKLISAPVGWTLFGIWILGLIAVGIIVPATVNQFRSSGKYEVVKNFPVGDKALFLNLQEAGNENYENTKLRLEGYEGTEPKLTMQFEARGRNRQDALNNARMVEYTVTQSDSVINFDSNFEFKPGSKFRVQELNMVLYIPYGKEFAMNPEMHRILRNTLYQNGYGNTDLEGSRWKFTPKEELVCLTCYEDKDVATDEVSYGKNRKIKLSDFNRLEIMGPFIVNIKRGDRFSIQANGDEDDLDEVEFDVDNGQLKIGYRNHFDFEDKKQIEIFITMPTLEAISLAGATNASIKGFTDRNDMDVQLSGAAQAKMNVEANQITLELTGASQLELDGEAYHLDATVNSASKLEAYGMSVRRADLEVNSAGGAEVNVTEDLNAEANSGGQIRYKGSAHVQSDTNSGGSVERES